MKSIKFITSLFVFAILFQSCITTRLTDREGESKVFGIDFREYSEKGFLFTPNEYFGEHDVLGIITIELHPKVVYRKGRISGGDDFYSIQFHNGNELYSKLVKPVNLDDLIKRVYELSIEWGGNAFTQFKSDMDVDYTDGGNPDTSYIFYSVSGVVIKRK